jgi:hypothetical protein
MILYGLAGDFAQSSNTIPLQSDDHPITDLHLLYPVSGSPPSWLIRLVEALLSL